MYAASTRSLAGPLHQPPYKLQDVSGASEVCSDYKDQRGFTDFLLSMFQNVRLRDLEDMFRCDQ